MNKFAKQICSLIFVILHISTVIFSPLAQAQQACTPAPISFLFYNGVNTTFKQAYINLGRIRSTYESSLSSGDVSFDVQYNYSNGFEDFVETFAQLSLAQDGLLKDRYEFFFQITNGGGSFLSKVSGYIAGTASIFDAIKNAYLTKVVSQLASIFAAPLTESDYLKHEIKLDEQLAQGRKLLFFAHSQGNLFASVSFDYLYAKGMSDAARVVHVAPPSSALRGKHVLADMDIVIQGLRAIANVPPVTDLIPPYIDRPAGINNETDPKGHGLVEIYINESMPDLGSGTPAKRIRTYLESALKDLRQCASVAKICPDAFTQTQLANITPGMSISQVDVVFGCQHRAGAAGSNWAMWFNDTAFTSMNVDMAYIYFTNGLYMGADFRDKYILGPVFP